MPIYNIAGGSADVTTEADDDDDDSDDADDDDDDAADTDTWTPPTRAEFDKLLADKAKADSESAARKRLLRANGLDPKTGNPVAKPKVILDDVDDDEDDGVSEADAKAAADAAKGLSRDKTNKTFQRQLEREIAKTERTVKDQMTTLISAVPEALGDEGWNGKNLSRMLKLLDLDAVEVDSDGDIEGLVEQVQELKKDFPEFFKRTRMRDAAKDVADTEAVGGGKKKVPAADSDLDWKARLQHQLYNS